MQSIERDDHAYPPPTAYHSQPTTPQAARPTQRQHHYVDLTQDSPGHAQPIYEVPHRQYDRRQPFQQVQHGGDIVDLTSSPRRAYGERRIAQPEVIRVISNGDGRYVQAPIDQQNYARVPEGAPHAWPAEAPHPHARYHDANAVEYDPNRPLLDVRERAAHNTAPSSRYGSPAQSGWRQREQIPSEHAHHPVQPMVQYTYPVPGAWPAPAPVAQSRAVPQPVHGAPAPVQQMPRELAQSRHTPIARYDLVAADPQRQPVYVAPQHAQYHPR
jgi:hypothetical protein